MPTSGLGAIQFYPVNYGTAAPQSLTRQLSSDDERTRQSALQAIGVPGMYTVRGHVPYPRSVQLELAPLSPTGDVDALLTVELEHHIVTAVLMPERSEWKRIATVIFPTATADISTTPATFLRTQRSVLEPNRYRAVFHARLTQANGDFIENEAHLRIFNGRASIVTSFVSDARTCGPAPSNGRNGPTCQLAIRWLQPDKTQPPGVHRFDLVTATGNLSGKDSASPLADSRNFQLAHLRSYTCQPFIFSDATLRYEPAGPAAPCARKAPTR